MDQYQKGGPAPAIKKTEDHDDIDHLRRKVIEQDKRIDELDRQLSRFKNELRVAISTFNLKSRG